MRILPFSLFTALVLLGSACRKPAPPVMKTGGQSPMPAAWIDSDTRHRVVRLTGPEGDNRSFYFHNPPFLSSPSGKGDLMVYYGSSRDDSTDRLRVRGISRQLYTVNLETGEIRQITHSPGRISGEIVAPGREEVYYQSGDSVFATHVGTLSTRLVYVFPDSLLGQVTTVNADETLLGGVFSEKEKYQILREHPRKGDYFNLIFEARIPHTLFTIQIDSGRFRTVFGDTAWLNHVQFSPSDPELLMFCHEGPWHKLDRIWTVNLKHPEPELMHRRTVEREIAGHEFFSPDGKTIWFDLQIPRGETFYLAGLDLETGKETRYGMKRDEWSIHFNQSPDETLFAGDGGDSTQVAKARNGQWIYLFRPAGDSLVSEKLVNMAGHNYETEPNVHFSPDGRWVIFRANFEGRTQIYAVEVKPYRKTVYQLAGH
jgi:oligogalacturonide lyase